MTRACTRPPKNRAAGKSLSSYSVSSAAAGYIVERFSYRPIFTMAGLMHPLALVLVLRLLPDRRFSTPSACPPR